MSNLPLNNYSVYIFAVLSSILWGSTAAVSKLLLLDMSNAQVLFYSTLFASLSLFAISISKRRLKSVTSYRPMDFVFLAAMSFLGVFMYRLLLQEALIVMPAQEAFIINYLWPVFVVVFAWLILEEKLTRRAVMALLLSFAGVILAISKGKLEFQFNLDGVTYALLGAMSYGLFSVWNKKRGYDVYTSTMFYYVFAFIYSCPFLVTTSSFVTPSSEQLLGLLWLGIFPSGLGFLFWLMALAKGDTAKASNLIFLTPFVSLVYIHILLHEQIQMASVVGLLIMSVGFIVMAHKPSPSKPD